MHADKAPAVTAQDLMSAQRRTTLNLALPIGPDVFREVDAHVVVVDVLGTATTFIGKALGDGDIEVLGLRSMRYAPGGESKSEFPLLAHRTQTGPWTVVDSRVSALLPKIDAALEVE